MDLLQALVARAKTPDTPNGDEDTRIKTLLGSCVSFTLWHPERKIGGMCHYMLPQRPRRNPGDPLDGRYAEDAMQMFMLELRHSRTLPSEYQVKLFGGGIMSTSRPITPVESAFIRLGSRLNRLAD